MSADEPDKYRPEERAFADQVRKLREDRGMSQSDLAEALRRVGIDYATQTTVSRIEKLARPVRMIEAQALSQIFNKTVHMMMTPTSALHHLNLAEGLIRSFQDQVEVIQKAAVELHEAWEFIRDARPQLEEKLDEEPVSPGEERRIRNAMGYIDALARSSFDHVITTAWKDALRRNGEHPEAP